MFTIRILAKKVLKKYNYWRRVFGLSFLPKKNKLASASSGCQVACYSAPCQADPSCHGDDGPPDDDDDDG